MCVLDARKFPWESGVCKGEVTMGLFTKLSARIPRGLALVTMGFAGIFGMRTPPDPEVIAQTAPSPHAAGTGSDDVGRDGTLRWDEAAAADEKNAPGPSAR
jgi:hypothetical protein